MKYLKNIDYESVQNFASLVTVQEGQVISRTIAQNDALSLTLFAFGAGEEISTHKSGGDALVIALEGKGEVTIDGKKHCLEKGDAIVMPAGHPHAVRAPEAFKMFLVVVFGK
ncbi:MAG: cupin domain-containing protein [Synergistes sp.]|nr:cupin domain-containing protein [Synergistes sp.]